MIRWIKKPITTFKKGPQHLPPTATFWPKSGAYSSKLVRFFFPASYDIPYIDPFIAKGYGNIGSRPL